MKKMKNSLFLILSVVLLAIGIGSVRLEASAATASNSEPGKVELKNSTLYLSGNVSVKQIANVGSKTKVKEIICKENCVLPEGCTYLFAGYSNCNYFSTGSARNAPGRLVFINNKLYLSGNVSREQILGFEKKAKVKKVLCTNNCVLPKDCSYLFKDYANLISFETSLRTVGLRIENMTGMFSGLQSLEACSLPKTLETKNLDRMFANCPNLLFVSMEKVSTSKNCNLSKMFYGCTRLQSLDLTSFYCGRETKTNYMFLNCVCLCKLKLGSSFKMIKTDMCLSSVGAYWSNEQTNELICEGQKFSAFVNNGVNTYIRRPLN